MKDKVRFQQNIFHMVSNSAVVADFSVYEEDQNMVGSELCELSKEELIAIKSAAELNTRLRYLKFNNCKLSVIEARFLAKIVQQHPELQKLDLDGNDLRDIGIIILCNAIKGSKRTMRRLSLSYNNIGAAGAAALRELLDLDILQELIMDDNPLGFKGINALFGEHTREDHEDDDEISKYRYRINLKTISLISCQLDKQSAQVLAKGITIYTGLQHLFLDRNLIDDQGVDALSLAFMDSESLQELSLTKCGFSKLGAWSLGRMLRGKNRLRELDISGNRIGADGLRNSDGTEGLAVGIKIHSYLNVINLDRTDLGNGGAIIVADLISYSYVLINVDMSYNNIDDVESIRAITLAMQVNTSVTGMTLHGNSIRDSSVALFIAMLKNNKILSVLGLNDCEITDIGAQLWLDFVKMEFTDNSSDVVNISLSSEQISQEMRALLDKFINCDDNNTVISSLTASTQVLGEYCLDGLDSGEEADDEVDSNSFLSASQLERARLKRNKSVDEIIGVGSDQEEDDNNKQITELVSGMKEMSVERKTKRRRGLKQ